jgi:hypothetical protein
LRALVDDSVSLAEVMQHAVERVSTCAGLASVDLGRFHN